MGRKTRGLVVGDGISSSFESVPEAQRGRGGQVLRRGERCRLPEEPLIPPSLVNLPMHLRSPVGIDRSLACKALFFGPAVIRFRFVAVPGKRIPRLFCDSTSPK